MLIIDFTRCHNKIVDLCVLCKRVFFHNFLLHCWHFNGLTTILKLGIKIIGVKGSRYQGQQSLQPQVVKLPLNGHVAEIIFYRWQVKTAGNYRPFDETISTAN